VGALQDEVSFELREGGEDVEDQRGGVDALLERAKPHLPPGGAGRECRHQMAEGSAEPGESPHHERVARAELVEDLVEFGACRQCPAGRVDVEE
jgi:hypothetical protein